MAFAEVASFIRYFVREAGDDALPRLLVKMRDAADPSDLAGAIRDCDGNEVQGAIATVSNARTTADHVDGALQLDAGTGRTHRCFVEDDDRALELARQEPERRFLQGRVDELE